MSPPPAWTHRSPWLTVTLLCAGQMMIVLDQNVVNVALPAVQRDLGFSSENLIWVVNGYIVPFGGLLLLAGRLGDLIGRKVVFLTGVVLFSASSVLCGAARSETMLIASRFVQGSGGAVAAACILGMVATVFPDARRRARAVAAYSFASAGGGAVGPLLGGVLTDLLGWHWIFFVNAPIGAALVTVGLRVLPADRRPETAGKVDVLGAVLVTAGMTLLVATVVEAEQAGWGAARVLVLGPVALLALTGFLLRQAQTPHPLLPLGLFRSRPLVVANLVQFLLIAGMFGLLFFGTLYLQRGLGYGSMAAGFGFVPIAVVIAAVSLCLTTRLVTRYGPRAVLCAGLALVVVAFAMLSFARADGTYVADFLPASLVMGTGFGLAAPALMVLGMAAVPPAESGVASGLFNTTQQLGGAIGLTVLSALGNARRHALAAAGHGGAAVTIGGYHAAFLAAGLLALSALLVAARGLGTAAAEGTGAGGVRRPRGARRRAGVSSRSGRSSRPG